MISDIGVNWLAVLVAAVLNMGLGTLWYGPLFGKPWMKSMGWDPNMKIDDAKRKEGNKAMMLMVPVSLLTAVVLAGFIDFTGSVTWQEGVICGFWLWLGFQATLLVQSVIFEGKKKETAVINAGYQLASLAMMGAIIAAWA